MSGCSAVLLLDIEGKCRTEDTIVSIQCLTS